MTTSSDFGNEPEGKGTYKMTKSGSQESTGFGDSLKGNHKGWFMGVIPSFPAENQQDRGS